MASVNKVIVIGNVGKDPEVRYTPSGSAVANISVATSRAWKDKTTGDKVEETEWHRVTLFDRRAEVAGEYLRKGSSVYIEGYLKTRKWQDKEGVERYTTEIVCEDMKMLGGRGEAGAEQGGQQQSRQAPSSERGNGRAQAAAPAANNTQRRAAPPTSGTKFDSMEDDLPF